MKKLYAVLLIIIVLLSGCDPGCYYFDADEIADQAVKIQLVICENPSPQKIIVKEDTVLYFDVEDAEIVETLENEKIEEFAKDLSTVTFHIENESVNAPIGYAVLIHMQNQEIIVLSCTTINGVGYGMAAAFSIDGNFLRHIACFADAPKFRRILAKYFELQ